MTVTKFKSSYFHPWFIVLCINASVRHIYLLFENKSQIFNCTINNNISSIGENLRLKIEDIYAQPYSINGIESHLSLFVFLQWKYCRLSNLNHKHLFHIVLKLGKYEINVPYNWCLVRLYSLVHRLPSSCCVLT